MHGRGDKQEVKVNDESELLHNIEGHVATCVMHDARGRLEVGPHC